MEKSKNQRKKTKSKNKNKTTKIPKEVRALVGIFASTFILLSFLTGATGKAGELTRIVFTSIFSDFSIVVSIFIFAVSIANLIPKLREVKFLRYRLYYSFFLGTFIIYATAQNGGYHQNLPISIQELGQVCQRGQSGIGSGLLGEIAVAFIGKYMGRAGNILLGIFLIFTSYFYGFNISFAKKSRELINRIRKLLKNSKRRKKPKKQVSQQDDIEIIGFNQQVDEELGNDAPKQPCDIEPAIAGKKETAATQLNIKSTDKCKETSIVNEDTICRGNFEGYRLPPIALMKKAQKRNSGDDKKVIMQNIQSLEKTLMDFGVEAKVNQVSVGPAITRYELQPKSGVKVSKIVNLSDDIALNLAASSIRIEAPIPGKSAVGIEVPNKSIDMVTFGDMLDSSEFKTSSSKLSFALGKDISGANIVTDISKMPHMLIAGATGSGKSVCVNSLIMSILYKAKPDEVKFIMIDPKVVELSNYNDIPHLLIPVVTDPQKAAMALNWAVNEMTKRYNLFAENSVKDIESYNQKSDDKLPKIIVIIDELADLMLSSPKEVEDSICRLAQMARAAGMHLVIATQRPSVDVITGVIKANIPSRVAFAVSSQTDSRTILDMGGAEKLLGKGDMLFYPVGQSKPHRIQGAFISEDEIQSVVDYVKRQDFGAEGQDTEIMQQIENIEYQKESFDDEIMEQAVDYVIKSKQASASMLQRKFRIGFNRAARIIDEMESKGIIGPSEGSKPRKVLVSSNNTNSEGD